MYVKAPSSLNLCLQAVQQNMRNDKLDDKKNKIFACNESTKIFYLNLNTFVNFNVHFPSIKEATDNFTTNPFPAGWRFFSIAQNRNELKCKHRIRQIAQIQDINQSTQYK